MAAKFRKLSGSTTNSNNNGNNGHNNGPNNNNDEDDEDNNSAGGSYTEPMRDSPKTSKSNSTSSEEVLFCQFNRLLYNYFLKKNSGKTLSAFSDTQMDGDSYAKA